VLTESQVYELLHGDLPWRVGEQYRIASLSQFLLLWRQYGRDLLADWKWRPPIVPAISPADREWRRQNASKYGFPADGSHAPPSAAELDQRPYGQQVAEYLRDHPDQYGEVARLFELPMHVHRGDAVRGLIFQGGDR
jgi:hypothetical protein